MEQLMFKVSLDEGGGKDLNGVSMLLELDRFVMKRL